MHIKEFKMGGRGSGGGRALLGRTQEQDKILRKIAKQTANLKNEQYRIIDKNGEVIYKAQGSQDRVEVTPEQIEKIYGNISIHNHPEGGTFSADDLYEFSARRGAREIVVTTPEATYRLIRTGKHTEKNWRDLADRMEEIHEANSSFQAVTKEVNARIRKTSAYKERERIMNRLSKVMEKNGVRSAEFTAVSEKSRARLNELDGVIRKEKDRLTREVEYNEPIIKYLKTHATEYGLRFVVEKRKRRK